MLQQRHFYLARLWFVLDAVIALTPPLYWSADNYKDPILGMPATLFYFSVVCLSIVGSILYAYWEESARGTFVS
jgi:hypothetical protein